MSPVVPVLVATLTWLLLAMAALGTANRPSLEEQPATVATEVGA